MLLPVLLSIALVFNLILLAPVAGASATVHRPDDCFINHLAIDGSRLAPAMVLNTPQGQVTPMVAAGNGHTVGLKSDGTVVAVGRNKYGQCDVGSWTDIIQVAAGDGHTVGLKTNGTVVTVGYYVYGQCNVSGWTDIVQVAAGSYHTVGLKADGTVVAVGAAIELAKWNLVLAVPPSQYVLTISSAAGGSATTPGEGVFTYNAGAVVRVIAEPEKGYRFVHWTGDMGTIANVNAATTIITMHGDYSITADFEEKPLINWLLIGGIVAAVVIVGLVIFFVRRRKRKTAFEAKLHQ